MRLFELGDLHELRFRIKDPLLIGNPDLVGRMIGRGILRDGQKFGGGHRVARIRMTSHLGTKASCERLNSRIIGIVERSDRDHRLVAIVEHKGLEILLISQLFR